MNENEELIELWQNQPTKKGEVSVEQAIARAESFQSKVRIRNGVEYIAAGALALYAVYFGLKSAVPLVMRAGVILIALGGAAAALLLKLRAHAAMDEPAPSAPTASVLRWHLAELRRQRDFLRRVPLLYLTPFAPGMLVAFGGAFWLAPSKWATVASVALFIAAVFSGVVWLNRRAATKLEEEIDALDEQLGG